MLEYLLVSTVVSESLVHRTHYLDAVGTALAGHTAAMGPGSSRRHPRDPRVPAQRLAP